jgi:hypothetical protein
MTTTKKPKRTKKAAVKKVHRITVSAVARALIRQGKSNEQVWETLKSQFKLDDSKKYYPTWYRSELKRHPHVGEGR